MRLRRSWVWVSFVTRLFEYIKSIWLNITFNYSSNEAHNFVCCKTTDTIIMKNLWKFEIIIEFQEIIRLKTFLPIYNCWTCHDCVILVVNWQVTKESGILFIHNTICRDNISKNPWSATVRAMEEKERAERMYTSFLF